MCRITTHGHNNIIITGPNGAGKTAILEAVSMLSGDRGMRGAQMSDIARFTGNGGFSVFAGLVDETELSVLVVCPEYSTEYAFPIMMGVIVSIIARDIVAAM